ncbi:MAG: MFS transporter, partial [Myxococcales bacterium]|nr:MFS transporter [Myxococcales bacterium]
MHGQMTLREKWLYAAGNFGTSLLPTVFVGWTIYFYAPPPDEGMQAYVSLAAVGIITFLGRLVDAVADPIVGHWSDTSRSPRGRRIPFVLYGTPGLVLTFVLLWFPPVQGVSTANAVYLGVMMGAFWFFYTVVVAPYLSLLPEISTVLAERVSVSTYMAVFEVLSLIVGSLVVGPIVEFFSGGVTLGPVHFGDGFKIMGVLMGVIGGASFLMTGLTIRETPHHAGKDVTFPFAEAMSSTFRNPGFPPYLVTVSMFRVAIDVVVVSIPFLVKTVMREGEAWAGVGQGLVVIVATMMFPAVTKLSEVWGKRKLMILGGAGFALVLPIMFTIGKWPMFSPLTQGMILFALAGIPTATLLVLPRPMLADVIDMDAARTGFRREAMYNGME